VSSAKRVVVAAPAKINLCLHVGSRRPDGYHDLESLVAFTARGDTISIETGEDFCLSVDGTFAADLVADDNNLALRAARLLAEEVKFVRGARIDLTKNLPVASGIGGGSADAAATLRALACLWDMDVPDRTLYELAESLGADVPVCIRSAPAWMEGKGERITILPALPAADLLLVNPGVPVPTGAVFAALRERRGVGLDWPRGGFNSVAPLIEFLQATTNDLEGPARAIAPEVGEVLGEIAGMPGALLTRMSGSGATCFAIFESDREITAAADRLAARHPGWWIRKTTIAPPEFAAPVLFQ
jgi:4-diphosphocytidyl-2-C-methyl-D-erythritol kinase